MKRFFALLVVLLSTQFVQAQFIQFPECTTKAGKPVTVVALEEIGAAGALIHPDDNQAYILLAPSFFKNLDPVAQMFVYLHECAHHELGHTADRRKKTNEWNMLEEVDADCYATKKLRDDYKVHPTKMKSVWDLMKDWPEDPEHLAGLNRLKAVKICLNVRD